MRDQKNLSDQYMAEKLSEEYYLFFFFFLSWGSLSGTRSAGNRWSPPGSKGEKDSSLEVWGIH